MVHFPAMFDYQRVILLGKGIWSQFIIRGVCGGLGVIYDVLREVRIHSSKILIEFIDIEHI